MMNRQNVIAGIFVVRNDFVSVSHNLVFALLFQDETVHMHKCTYFEMLDNSRVLENKNQDGIIFQLDEAFLIYRDTK